MTKNTPTLIPGSWDYFFPFSYFLTPLISITSLAVLWWWQARLLPSAALLFPLTRFCYVEGGRCSCYIQREFTRSDAFWQNGCLFPVLWNWYTLSKQVFQMVSLCHLVPDFLLHSGNVRFNVAFQITFSWKKCVIESGHPMNTLNSVRDVSCLQLCIPRGLVTTVNYTGVLLGNGLLVLYDFKEALRVTSPILALSVLVCIYQNLNSEDYHLLRREVVALVVYPYFSTPRMSGFLSESLKCRPGRCLRNDVVFTLFYCQGHQGWELAINLRWGWRPSKSSSQTSALATTTPPPNLRWCLRMSIPQNLSWERTWRQPLPQVVLCLSLYNLPLQTGRTGSKPEEFFLHACVYT